MCMTAGFESIFCALCFPDADGLLETLDMMEMLGSLMRLPVPGNVQWGLSTFLWQA